MLRIADLMERINQCVLVLGIERNVKVDRGASGRGTKALPVGWNGIPGMFHTHVMPRWWEWRDEVSEGTGGDEDGEQRETVVAHDYRGSLAVTKARGPERAKHWNVENVAFIGHLRVRIEVGAEPRVFLWVFL